MIRGMEKHGPEPEDDLLPEYDLTTLKGGVRGKYWLRYHRAELRRLPSAEATPFPIICRCGQSFNVYVGAHPAKVNCHVCGHKMIVAQHGNTIHLTNREDEGLAENDVKRIDTAICEMPPRISSTAVTLPIHLDAFAASASGTESRGQLTLDDELKKVDLDWHVEQLKYRTCGRRSEFSLLFVSTVLCLGIFVPFVTLPILTGLRDHGIWFPCMSFLAAPAGVSLCVCVFFWAQCRVEYLRAKAEYHGRRRAVLARHSGL
jgi:hypothetical protein